MATKSKPGNTRRKRAEQRKSAPKTAAPATVPQTSVTDDTEVVADGQLSTAWTLLRRSLRLGSERWRFWLSFVVLFAILNLILVHNFSGDVASVKSQLASFLGEHSPATGLGTYALLIANNTSTGGAAGAYQYLLLIIASLAAIWGLRQEMVDKAPARLRLRDSLYRGMTPLIPFVIVLVVLSLELIPVILAGGLYGIVASGGIIRTWFEQLIFLAVFAAGLGLTVWLLMRSVFAMYIVTLPDMTPLRALRDAAQIVKGRQLNLIRKLLFLLAVLLVGSMIVLIPVIFLAPVLTQPLFFVLSIIALPFVHAYLYSLYRELLG